MQVNGGWGSGPGSVLPTHLLNGTSDVPPEPTHDHALEIVCLPVDRLRYGAHPGRAAPMPQPVRRSDYPAGAILLLHRGQVAAAAARDRGATFAASGASPELVKQCCRMSMVFVQPHRGGRAAFDDRRRGGLLMLDKVSNWNIQVIKIRTSRLVQKKSQLLATLCLFPTFPSVPQPKG